MKHIVILLFFTLLFANEQEELLKKLPAGYINPKNLPDSVAIVPKAPAPGSPRQKLDDAIAAAAVKLNKTARFKLATQDANLHFPDAPNNFACAMGKVVSKEKTPRLYKLLKRAAVDAGLATSKAKHTYNRMRPFTLNNAPICTPELEQALRKDGSYPSGHTSLGWAWALILSELLPEKANTILERGVSYGESRIICNVHWYSDVLAGRMIGASAVALMHNNPEFIEDMKAAKAEFANTPAPDKKICQEEAEALSTILFP